MPEAPPAPPPPTTTEPPLPVSHVEVSKSIFKQAMEDVVGKPQTLGNEVGGSEPTTAPAPAAPATTEAAPADKSSAIPDDIIAPPKDEPKQDEVIAAIEAMQLPKSAKPEQIARFSDLKEKAKSRIESQAKTIHELEEKIGQTTNKAELESLQSKLTAAEEKATKIEEDFSRTAYEQSPRFRSKFVAREVTAIEGAKKCLEGTEISPEIIEVAARVTGQKRRDILKNAGIEGDLLSEVAPYLVSYDSIQSDKKAALDNWRGESARLVEENNAKAQAEKARKAANENRVWESVFHKTDLIPLRKSKENAEWNTRAEELSVRAKEIFNGEGVPLDTFAETIQKGVAYDAVNDVLNKVLAENKNLKAENANLKSARPGAAMTVTNGAAPKVDETKMKPEERHKATFNEEMAKVGGR